MQTCHNTHSLQIDILITEKSLHFVSFHELKVMLELKLGSQNLAFHESFDSILHDICRPENIIMKNTKKQKKMSKNICNYKNIC